MKTTAYLAFVLLGVIWGSNFIFMKWAAEDISPRQIVLLRVVFGFLPILVFALAQRALRWEHTRYVHHFVVMSLLATVVYYLAFAKGTALLPSSIAGLSRSRPSDSADLRRRRSRHVAAPRRRRASKLGAAKRKLEGVVSEYRQAQGELTWPG
jgi:hypothetical protein